MEGKFGNGVRGIRTILWLTLASKREQANQGVRKKEDSNGRNNK